MTSVFILDVPENSGPVELARNDPGLSVDMVGPYFQIWSVGDIRLDRQASGCRHAVWYSVLAGISGGEVVQHDAEALRVEQR